MKAAVLDEIGPPTFCGTTRSPTRAVRSGGILLEVRAIGIQGGDLINRREGQGRPATRRGLPGQRRRPRARRGCDRFAVGQRVVAMMMKGSHAELASVSARKVWAIPDTLTFEDAAAVPVEFGTADDCLFEFGRLQAGESVLVQAGSGGVGPRRDPARQGRRRTVSRPRSPTVGSSA